LRFAADIVGDQVEAAHLIDNLACQVSQRAAGRADRLLRVYSVEKLAFGAETKNLVRYDATLARSAEGLPLEGANLTWIASGRLDRST
jgi:hypothetical protein